MTEHASEDDYKRGEGYSLEPTASPPPLPGTVVLHADADAAIDALLLDLVSHSIACVREFGDFHLALHGHPFFDRVYLRMMIDPRFRELPWKRTHLWLVQEKADQSGAAQSYMRIFESIVEHADIPPEQAHAVDLSASDPAAEYEEQIRGALEWREPGHDRLDAALVGPFADDHEDRPDSNGLVRRGICSKSGQPVISLTSRFLRSSRLMSILATGAGCRADLQAMAGPSPERTWPLAPVSGVLRWYLDHDAVRD